MNVFEAKRLLRGKHLVFIGDSRVRYQYLSFVYWLLYDGKIEGAGPLPEKSIVKEKQWTSWNEFYNDTNRILSTRGAREICDCFREYLPSDAIENRQWVWEGMKISYFQYFATDLKMRGHTFFSPQDPPLMCSPGRCRPPTTWNGTIYDGIIQIAEFTNLTHLVVTNGWGTNDGLVGSPLWNRTAATLTARNVKVILQERAAPPSQLNNYPPLLHNETFVSLRSLSNYYYSLPDAHWDDMHYNSWVYYDFSQLLLNSLQFKAQ
jgi:hypothetical protein